jgi:hypothetical protein
LKTVFAFSILIAAAQAQYPGGYPGQYPGGGYPGGGYPGGGYPGGGYPGRTTPGIPIPRRSNPQGDSTKGQPLPNFRGHLKQMDAKSITLELDDNRVLDFKRTDKTKFFKGGDELKTPEFSPGDQLSVEGPRDQAGYLTAVNVYWEKAADKAAVADRDKNVHDTWKDDEAKPDAKEGAAKDAKEADAAVRPTEPAPPPARPDSSDPGPPTLRRGKPADVARERAAPVPEVAAAQPPAAAQQPQAAPSPAVAPPPPAAPRPVETARAETGAPMPIAAAPASDEEIFNAMHRPMDPLIRKATEAAMEFTETLPDYVCQEMMARFQSESHPASWQPLDVVSTNVIYRGGKEEYRDLAINGKPVKKTMEEIGGAWSTGEFGTVLIDLFSPATDAQFRGMGDSRMAGVSTKKFDFEVKRENSHWTIHMASQTYNPAYKGTVWIDPATSRVLRIEMEALNFPDEFPTDHVESATDYQYIRLGDARQYLLPVHAETLSCQRMSNYCSRNTIDFRNYHKYTGESTIQYQDVNSNVKFDDKEKDQDKEKSKKP